MFVTEFKASVHLEPGVMLSCVRYTGRDHYHLAHAYNLAVRASVGEYVAVMGADAVLSKDYVRTARQRGR
jgi:hypothetical protein